MGIDSCAFCGSPATLICGGCGEVAYCSRDHQKKHWKAGHKVNCKAYKIEVHPQYGRYLVTTRDLKPGSRILSKVQPSVLGPQLNMIELCCVRCTSKILFNKASVQCPQCHFPICSKRCIHEETDPLCKFLAKVPNKQNLQLITPLKFLMLKDSNPDLFANLLKLESHSEELKKSERWKEYKGKIIEPLTALDDAFDENLIVKLVGILATNTFEIQGNHASNIGLGIGLFELPALMNHDCIGNTRLVMDTSNNDFKLSVYASVTIPKGRPILFNYVRPLDTMLMRKENLQSFKFFTCQCLRCLDSTELKTFNSSYLCPKCQTGPICYHIDGDVKNWVCFDCQYVIEDNIKIKFLEDQVTNARLKLKNVQSHLDLAQAKQIYHEMSQYLYPSHGFMQEIKQVLVMCHASASNNPGQSREPIMQKERIKFIDDILESLDILEPGLSLGRGKIFFYLVEQIF